MDVIAILAIEVLHAVASLALISVGLAIIFGMMRVINFAHGEFLMLGAFSAIVATNIGINIWISMLVVAPLAVGVLGMIIERLLIRHLYGRMVETLLATWGLSFLLIGVATSIFGNTTRGISAPLGSLSIGAYKTGLYTVFITLLAGVVLLATYIALRHTRAGIIARGTMQNAEMSGALGVRTPVVYTLTFGIGAALSGLAGAVLAPYSGVVPAMGLAYIAKAFITVISGGASVLVGTALASLSFGVINQIVTFVTTPVVGEVALLVAAVVLLRVMPQGITGRWFRNSR